MTIPDPETLADTKSRRNDLARRIHVYAVRSGTTVAVLIALGRRVYPCHCDYDGCEG